MLNLNYCLTIQEGVGTLIHIERENSRKSIKLNGTVLEVGVVWILKFICLKVKESSAIYTFQFNSFLCVSGKYVRIIFLSLEQNQS